MEHLECVSGKIEPIFWYYEGKVAPMIIEFLTIVLTDQDRAIIKCSQ